MVVKLFCS